MFSSPPPLWGHTTLFWKKYLAVPLGVAPHVKAAFAILFLICKIPVLIAMCTRGFLNNSAGSVKSDCTTNNSEAMVRPFKTIFPIKFLMSHFLRSWVGEVVIWCRNLYLCPQVNTYMVSILERLGGFFVLFALKSSIHFKHHSTRLQSVNNRKSRAYTSKNKCRKEARCLHTSWLPNGQMLTDWSSIEFY